MSTRRRELRTRLARALLLCAGVLLAQACERLTPEQLYDDASRSVAALFAADAAGKIVARGSGVFMDKNLLVTNCHVVALGKVLMVGHARRQVTARLVGYDADRDLCMLHAPELSGTPARIGDIEGVRVGHKVFAIGTPEGFALSLSEGVVSGLREATVGRYIQTTAPMSEGSSGGGLFDSNGRLIGIASFVFSSGQNLNFAAPVDWAVALTRKVSGTGDPPQEVTLPPSLTKQWRHPLLLR